MNARKLASGNERLGFFHGEGTRGAALVLLVPATPWHASLCFPSENVLAALLVFLLGMAPYVLLAVLARWLRYPFVVAISGLVLLASDASAGYSALRSTSSTGGVALMIQPLFGLFVVVPAAMVVALLLRRALDSDPD